MKAHENKKEKQKTGHHRPQCAKWFSRYSISKSGIWARWTSPFCRFSASFSLKYDVTDAMLQDNEKMKLQYLRSLLFDLFETTTTLCRSGEHIVFCNKLFDTVLLSKFKMADEDVELKTSVDTSDRQPEIQHIEAENKETEKAKDKGEVDKADNNQSSKGKVDDCACAINDLAVGNAEGVAQVCNETSKIIFGDALFKYMDKIKARADKDQLK